MKIQGLIAAPFTPMQNDGELNLPMIKSYSNWLQKNGVKGVFVNGTTGEGMSLTVDERKKAVEEWKEQSKEALLVFAHVADNSLKNSLELANHAEDIGCDAIATLPPIFFKPASVKDLVIYCKEIANAASTTPFYFYHIPSMSGVNLPMIDFVEQAEKEIPTFAGLKFTFESLFDYGLCLNHNERLNILFGRDEMLLGGLAVGAKGAVGSFYNFLGYFANTLITDYHSGSMEEAQQKQQFLREFTRVLIKNGGNIATLKTIMKLSGIDCGTARLPLPKITEKEEIKLRNDLEAIGFFDRVLTK